jgi:hypothetical protein
MLNDIYEFLFCPIHGLVTSNLMLIGPALTAAVVYIRRIVK